MELRKGDIFRTDFERRCVVTVPPQDMPAADQTGPHTTFLALDSDGVECQYVTAMVVGHSDYRASTR